MATQRNANSVDTFKQLIKEDLESHASYQKFNINITTYLCIYKPQLYGFENIKAVFPPIQTHCNDCKNNTIFNFQTFIDTHTGKQIGFPMASGGYHKIFQNWMFHLTYNCSICTAFNYHFLIEIKYEDDGDILVVTKTAAWPRQKIQESKEIVTELNRYGVKDFYNNGRIVEAHGYGLAAAAYYRRAVEQTINKLIEEMKSTLSADELKGWIEEYGDRPTTATKIDEVLKFLGSNSEDIPLHTVYTHLSDGIHNLSDEDSLRDAGLLRELLILAIEEAAQKRKRKEAIKKAKDQLNAQRGQRGQGNKEDA